MRHQPQSIATLLKGTGRCLSPKYNKNSLESTRFLTFDHSWYASNIPLGSTILRVADTRLQMGSDRNRSRAREPASVVLARRAGAFVRPVVSNPRSSGLLGPVVSKGVDWGLSRPVLVGSSQNGAVSLRPPPVTKKRSSKPFFRAAEGGEVVVTLCDGVRYTGRDTGRERQVRIDISVCNSGRQKNVSCLLTRTVSSRIQAETVSM